MTVREPPAFDDAEPAAVSIEPPHATPDSQLSDESAPATGHTGQLVNRWALRLVPPAVYLVIALCLYWVTLRAPNQKIPGGPDGLLYCWYFKWTEYSITAHHNPFITDWLNAPFGINTMWNTGVFALALVFSPITYLFGPFVATAWAMTLCPVLCASTCYFVLRKLTGTGWRAAAVSLLYGFGPFFNGQAGHLHLIIAVFPPLIVYLGHRLLIRQPGKAVWTGVALGVVVGLQLLTGEEVLVLTTITTVFAVVVLMVLNPTRLVAKLRYSAVGTGVGVLVALAIAGVPLYFQFFGRNSLNEGVEGSSQRVGTAGLVVPTALQRFVTTSQARFTSTRLAANGVENTGYLGWPLLILIGVAAGWLLLRRERFIWWWIPTALFTVVLSLGSPIQVDTGHTLIRPGLWHYVRTVPLLKGVVPIRFTLITTMLVALLLGWALSRLPAGRIAAIGTVAVLAAMIPLIPAHQYRSIQSVQTPKFFTTDARNRIAPGAVVLALPVSNKPSDGSRVMVWQMHAQLRYKVVGGWGVFAQGRKGSYTSQLPAIWRVLNRQGVTGRQPSSTEIALARITVPKSGIRYIVITDQQEHAAAVSRTAAEITGCQLQLVSDVTVCEIPT